MDLLTRWTIVLLKFALLLHLSSGDTYSVRVETKEHINVVDKRFLSFTIDPKFLFSNSEKYGSQESICMASSLTPAYIRIAGPSTPQMTFKNYTISFTNLTKEKDQHVLLQKDTITPQKDENHKSNIEFVLQNLTANHGDNSNRSDIEFNQKGGIGILQSYKPEELTVTHSQWNKFVQWVQSTGFDLVFALNNEEKTPSGLWDPNTVLDILTVAEKANIAELYWQLGYECRNQSIEDYLSDLETLKVIIETFDLGQKGGWKVVGGDVTKCLTADSKSDFTDYVTLSDDLLDAVLLNGNSSAHELERMSEAARLKLLQRLSESTTPLWLTESPYLLENTDNNKEKIEQYEETQSHHQRGRKWRKSTRKAERRTRSNKAAVEKEDGVQKDAKFLELFRAADWMTSLGYSAKNGFSVHFRELLENELYEPTLSFYMALLHKNLVGERVLNVEMEASRAVLFAHCTSLRHKPVNGAVTLYGANMDDAPARFSVKLSQREKGGDVMQFVLGHNDEGNIIVNGRPMHYEGDMTPVVRRLGPYKTLLIHLPPKSFGFWVLANTNIEACQLVEIDDVNDDSVEELLADDDEELIVVKEQKTIESESVDEQKSLEDIASNEKDSEKNTLKSRIDNLKNDLNNVHTLIQTKAKSEELNRKKRGINDIDRDINTKLKRRLKNKRNVADASEKRPKFEIIRRLFGLPKHNGTSHFQIDRARIFAKLDKDKSIIAKRFAKQSKIKHLAQEKYNQDNTLKRKRRSISDNISKTKEDVPSSENEIDVSDNEKMKLWKILREIHEHLKDLPEKDDSENDSENSDYIDEEITSKVEETKSHDGQKLKMFKNKTKQGLLKSTVGNVMNVLRDLNKNLNNFWSALSLLD